MQEKNKSLKNTLYCDESIKTIINPVNLNFDDTVLEKAFVKKFNNDNLLHTRFGIILTFLLFSIYGFVDIYAYPSSYTTMWTIRFIEDIVLVVFFIYTFYPRYKRHFQRNNTLLLIFSGLNLIVLYSFTVETNFVYIFISSYSLLITGAFLTLGLLFFNALRTILLLDIALAMILVNIPLDNISILLYAILFLSTSILVILATYFWELNRRKLYLNNLCNDKLFTDLQNTQKELQEQANRDPMTDLYNRRYFHTFSQEVIKIAKREKKSVSVILIDIDNFKEINDTYGHLIGDNVIISLASLLTTHIRDSDIICRHGGEEFVILLPHTSEDGALELAEKLRMTVEALKVQTNTIDEINFTISLGISSVNIDKDKDIEKSLDRADKALYIAKDKGKNRVEVYT